MRRPFRIAALQLCAALLASSAACFHSDSSSPEPEVPARPSSSPPAATAVPLLYSRLNNQATVATPANGSGLGYTIKTTPARDFVAGYNVNGIRINAKNEYVRFREKNGTVQNVELDQGTVDFWYQPFYASTDGQAYRIFGIGPLNAAGSIALHKRIGTSNNELAVQIRDNANRTLATVVRPPNYSWVPGQWVNIRVTWDSKVGANVQNTRVYLDGQEPVYAAFSTGPFTMRAEATTQFIYVGNAGASTGFHANAILDEFMIYGTVLSPVPPTPETIPPTVAIGYPSIGSVLSGTIDITATATDNIGVAGVQFQVDGIDLGPEDMVAPYAVSWNTVGVSDGQHDVTAIARDAAGNRDTAAVVVPNVNNSSRPSVIVILVDDMRWDNTVYMPSLNQVMGPTSVQFTNSFVSHSLCCPSRATLLTGQYTHHHGVESNTGSVGGMARFVDATALPVPLKQSGYRTGYFGKYFNDYYTRPTYIPAGWTDWRAFNSAGPAYSNYTMNENGATIAYGAGSPEYSTNVIAGHAVQFINATPAGQPFFLVLAPSAPHYPSTPDPQDVGAFSSQPPWRPFSYNEADVSDKPSWVQALPLFTSAEEDSVDIEHQKQLESMLAVDRAVVTLMDALTAAGRLENTVVIFTSDNGLAWGEHRWSDSKLCPYEECLRVPLWIQAPGVAGRLDDHMVQNIDLAPTIADLADVSLLAAPVNGVSLMPLLQNPGVPWRTEILHETYSLLHPHAAVRTGQYTYVEYVNGDRELYDLFADPFQMDNVYGDPNYQAVIPGLQSLLQILKSQ